MLPSLMKLIYCILNDQLYTLYNLKSFLSMQNNSQDGTEETVCNILNYPSITIQILNSLVSPEMASVLLPCMAARSVLLGGCGYSDLIQKPLYLEGAWCRAWPLHTVAGLLSEQMSCQERVYRRVHNRRASRDL